MRIGKRLFYAGALLVFIALGFFGCCASNTYRPLEQAKTLAGQQNYAALAAMAIKCNESCEGCNQLYLIKGDACYRLAKNGDAPERHYQCAASDLKKGITLTEQWQMEGFGLGRSQTFTNLCESLRNLRDLRTGISAEAVNEQLLKNAQDFLAAEPGNPCAVYFHNDAQYTQLNKCLLHPESCPGLCDQLQHLQDSIVQGLASAGSSPCGVLLNKLKAHVNDAQRIARCR